MYTLSASNISEVPACVGVCDTSKRIAHRRDQVVVSSRLGRTQMLLDLGPHLLDRVQVRRVRRQVQQSRTNRLNQLSHGWVPVGTEPVHYHQIAFAERWAQSLPDKRFECHRIGRAVEGQGRRGTIASNRPNERRHLPAPLRHRLDYPLAGRRSAPRTGHSGRRSGFIHIDALGRPDPLQFTGVSPTHATNTRRVALAVVQRLFFSGNSSRANARHMVHTRTFTPRRSSSSPQSSASVASGRSRTSRRSANRARASNAGGRLPPRRLAARVPCSRCRRSSLNTNERLTPKSSAASDGLLAPSRQARQTRSLRSSEYDFMTRSVACQCTFNCKPL